MEGKYNNFGIPKLIVYQAIQTKLPLINNINIKTSNKWYKILRIAKWGSNKVESNKKLKPETQ